MSETQDTFRDSKPTLARFIERIGIFTFLGLIASLILLAVAIMVTLRGSEIEIFVQEATPIPIDFGEVGVSAAVAIPDYSPNGTETDLSRSTYFQTNRSDNQNYQAINYVVQPLGTEYLRSLKPIKLNQKLCCGPMRIGS